MLENLSEIVQNHHTVNPYQNYLNKGHKGAYLKRMYPSGTGSSFSIRILDCNLIFFCSGFNELSLRMSDMGLDLLRLFVSGNRDRFCSAAVAALLVGDVGNLPSGLKPGNRGKPGGKLGKLGILGIPGNMRPGGKNGFDSRRFCAATGD